MAALPTASNQMQQYGKAHPAPKRPPGPHPEITQNTQGFKNVTSGKDHVMRMQKFLNAQGYHVSVDGVMGPQTRAAVADWHTGPKHRPMLTKHVEATKTVLAGKNPPKTGGGGAAPK